MIRKKTKKNYDKTNLSVKDILKYIEEEIIILQKEISESDNMPKEQSKGKSGGADACGLLVMEGFMFGMLLDALFGGSMIEDMFMMLAGDDFEVFLGGLLAMLDNDFRSQKLQAPFILSIYPKGRKTVKTILKNINSSTMRRSASRGFATIEDKKYQLAILNWAEKNIKAKYGAYFLSQLNVISARDRAFRNAAQII